MAAVISMLRGVNVGGHNKINMVELRALYVSLGFPTARTFIQSGNVVFKSDEEDLQRLAAKIEQAIERKFAIRPLIILRTSTELQQVVAANPFQDVTNIDPAKLLVTFLAANPPGALKEKLSALDTDPELLRLQGREVFVYYSNGMGQSKFPTAVVERTLKTAGTARNWNSVLKMLQIAIDIEASD